MFIDAHAQDISYHVWHKIYVSLHVSLVPRTRKTWLGTHCLRMRVISRNFRKPYPSITHRVCSVTLRDRTYLAIAGFLQQSSSPLFLIAIKMKGVRKVQDQSILCRVSFASFVHFWKSDLNSQVSFWTHRYFATGNVAHARTVSTRRSRGYLRSYLCAATLIVPLTTD